MMCLGRIRLFAGWLLLGSIPGIQAGTVLGADRAPNIVLIVADDLGWGDVGFNGRTEWTTPQLDRLAADGVVLRHCYSAAPICGPSRGALLTGKYTIHTGVRRNDQDLPPEEVTIAEALKQRGYRSGLFGKWQHGKPRSGRDHYVHPMDQGFDDFFGFTDSYDALEKFPTQLWRGRQRVQVSGYADDLITDRAIEFLERHKDAPFFLDVSYLAPHFSIAAPAEEIERLKSKVPEADPLHLSKEGPLPQAPGQLLSHYAPLTPLCFFDHVPRSPLPGKWGLLSLQAQKDADAFAAVEVLSPDGNLREAAANLFSSIRKLDSLGLDGILALSVPEEGLGRAINDRLRRASGSKNPN